MYPHAPSASPKRSKLTTHHSNPMESFLDALDDLIVDSAEELTAIELLGALQLTQQRIALDILTVGEEDEEEAA
jgi:hypothetical protein